MPQLFRICYLREHRPVGVTFSAADLVTAMEFSEAWEARTKCPVLTLRALPASRFNPPPEAGDDLGNFAA